MKYKIIFSDFDGTIALPDNTISQRTKQSIADYRERGGKFVVATGRLFSSILPRVKEIGITEGEVIVYQGGGIYDIATGKPIYLNVIDKELAVSMLRSIEALDYYVPIVYFDDRCNCRRVDDAVSMFCKICGITPYETPDNIPLSDYVEANDVRPVKVLTLLMPHDSERYLEHMRATYGDKVVFTRSNKMIVEALPIGVNKGAACGRIADSYGVDASEVICAGDAENDISMIEYAGLGVAAPGAMQGLKDRADYISEAEIGDCIGDIIDRFCKE